MTTPQPIRLTHKLSQFDDFYNPRIVGNYNGNELRVAKLDGPFSWHSHADTDELFMVVRGRLRIEFRDGEAVLDAGDVLVVPRGIEHRPVADAPCEVMLIDREGEPNTGVNPSALTRATLDTI